MKRFARFLAQESRYLYDTDIKSVLSWVHNLYEKKAEDDKRPRDPRPILTDPFDWANSRYSYSGLHMSLFDKKKRIISTPTNCRDYFNEALRFHVLKGKGVSSHHVSDVAVGHFDYKMLRIAFMLDQPIRSEIPVEQGMLNGVRVANMYGRVAGWGPLRVVKARQVFEDSERTLYLVVGDPSWMRMPQFISILLLFIRISLQVEIPGWVRDAYSMQCWWAENVGSYGRPDDFSSFMYDVYKPLLTMFAHEAEIFPSDIKAGYDSNITDNFHYNSGISSFISGGNPTHPVAAKKLKQIYKAEVR